MFEVRPISRIGIKAMMMATGIVITGIIALGGCQRKMRITSETITISSIRVLFKFSMERRIRSERS